MSLYDFYHRFFSGRNGGNFRPPENDENYNSAPRDPSWFSDDERSDMRDFNTLFDFKIITDPFEMHNFFEKKFNEVFQAFLSPEEFPTIHGFDTFPGPPAIEEKQNPRDHYLKPGLNKPQPNNENLEEQFGGEPSGSITAFLDSLQPKNESSQPRIFSSFSSVTRRTVTLPDGTVKTEEIIRKPDGTEERTECHTLPDGSSSPHFDLPVPSPSISGFFDRPNLPETRTNTSKDQFLKPGYEKLSPNGEKLDKDLDKQILQSGIESLPKFSKETRMIEPNQNFVFKSITRRTVTLPSGVVESEEVVRKSDGTEERVVTQTLPDGSTSRFGNLDAGNNPSHQQDSQGAITSFALRGVKDFIDILFK